MPRPASSRKAKCRPAAALLAMLLLVAPLALAGSAAAQLGSGQIRGRAPQALDSGLLDFAGQRVYLYGLHGLGAGETCSLGSTAGTAQTAPQTLPQTWACGQEARWAARNRIAGHWVDCVERARGPGGEVFAVCYLGGVGGPELNAWLVEQGWARAATDYADDYAAAEAEARAAGRGLWRGQ